MPTVSDASYARALLKKLRKASAVLCERDGPPVGFSPKDAEIRLANARKTQEVTLKTLLEMVGDTAEVRAAMGEAGKALAEATAARRKRRREEAEVEAAARKRERAAMMGGKERQQGGVGGRSSVGGGRSEAVWAVHGLGKSVGKSDGRERYEALTTSLISATVEVSEGRVDQKACSAGMWAVAKIAAWLHDDVLESGAGASSREHKERDDVERALGAFMNALMKRASRLDASRVDARCVSGVLWASATTMRTNTGLKYVDDVLMRRAVNFAAMALQSQPACVRGANAQDAANALWGAAKTRRALDASCVESLVDALARDDEAKVEEMSIALWAIATLGADGLSDAGAVADPLAKKLKDLAKTKPKLWSAQAAANVAWAAEKLMTLTNECAVFTQGKQLVTHVFTLAAKMSSEQTFTHQGFAHVVSAAGTASVDARLLPDVAKFVLKGLKAHSATLTGVDLACVVEACAALKLHTSMSDGVALARSLRDAVTNGCDALEWQAIGRLDVAIDGVLTDALEAAALHEKLQVRGRVVCAEVDVNRLQYERGGADALLGTASETSVLAPPVEDAAALLVVDDGRRFVTKRLRRVGWQTTTWQRFSCGEHARGECWPEEKKTTTQGTSDNAWFDGAVIRMPTTKASLAMVLHVVAAKVKFGARVWIYGAATEGLKSIIPDLPKVRRPLKHDTTV